MRQENVVTTQSVPLPARSTDIATGSSRPLPYALLLIVAVVLSVPRDLMRVEAAGQLPPSPVVGLVAHWPLDEGAGPLTEDVAGGYTATLSNGAAWAPGRFGPGVALDGIEGYIAPPIIDVPGSAITLAAWVRVTGLSGRSDQHIISKSTGSSRQGRYWALGIVRTGKRYQLSFNLRAGGSTTTLNASSGQVPVDAWFHAAATYDGSMMRLYLDGVEVGRVAKAGAIAGSPIVPADIGRSPDGSGHLRGAVDEVRIYSRALRADEVIAVMEDPGGESVPDPDTTPPSIPGSLQASAPSSTSVSLQWNPSTDDGVVAGYRVKRNGLTVASIAGTSHADTGLTASTTYTYRVSAYDEAGNESADSAAATVTTPAGAPPNQPPTVTLTAPAAGATFVAPATFAMVASASDPENRLADVRFYVAGSLVGTDAAAPYSVSVASLAAGTYALAAVVRDSDGGSATSAVVTVTVAAPPPPSIWQVAFTASADHSTGVTNYLLEVFASGANPATATPLATSDLGKPAPNANNEVIVDRTSLFLALATGNYAMTVRAIGPGGSGRSSPYSFTR